MASFHAASDMFDLGRTCCHDRDCPTKAFAPTVLQCGHCGRQFVSPSQPVTDTATRSPDESGRRLFALSDPSRPAACYPLATTFVPPHAPYLGILDLMLTGAGSSRQPNRPVFGRKLSCITVRRPFLLDFKQTIIRLLRITSQSSKIFRATPQGSRAVDRSEREGGSRVAADTYPMGMIRWHDPMAWTSLRLKNASNKMYLQAEWNNACWKSNNRDLKRAEPESSTIRINHHLAVAVALS